MARITSREGIETYSRIHESRQTTVFHKAAEILEAANAASVLDYGGGDGTFLDQHLPGCVRSSAYYDVSEAMRAKAEARLGSKNVAFYSQRGDIEVKRFDAVLLIAAWMEFPSHTSAIENLAAIKRALVPGGHLIAAVTHPCFRDRRHSTFHTDFSMDDYLIDGLPFQATVFDGDAHVTFEDYHWNLQAMCRQLTEAGFRIEFLYELADAGAGGSQSGAPWLLWHLRADGA